MNEDIGCVIEGLSSSKVEEMESPRSLSTVEMEIGRGTSSRAQN